MIVLYTTIVAQASPLSGEAGLSAANDGCQRSANSLAGRSRNSAPGPGVDGAVAAFLSSMPGSLVVPARLLWDTPRLGGAGWGLPAFPACGAAEVSGVKAGPQGRRRSNAASLALCVSRQPVSVTFRLRVVCCPGECGGAPVDRGITTSPSIVDRSSVE